VRQAINRLVNLSEVIEELHAKFTVAKIDGPTMEEPKQ
jgi:hypothetical protein